MRDFNSGVNCITSRDTNLIWSDQLNTVYSKGFKFSPTTLCPAKNNHCYLSCKWRTILDLVWYTVDIRSGGQLNWHRCCHRNVWPFRSCRRNLATNKQTNHQNFNNLYILVRYGQRGANCTSHARSQLDLRRTAKKRYVDLLIAVALFNGIEFGFSSFSIQIKAIKYN